MSKALDATKITILAGALQAATEEMGLNLVRSAFSTIVRENRDCSTALLDPQGNVVAQALTNARDNPEPHHRRAGKRASYRADRMQATVRNSTGRRAGRA